MSMQVGLGIVGAVIGGYVGGPTGAQIGFALGSAIGAAAFPPEGPHLEGPRLSDLRGTVSTYGAGLARIYGEVGCPANIVWMDPIRETSFETEQGGKGGPTTVTTNYSYSASFAIALCDCEPGEEVSSLNRIWINGTCYYDVRDEANLGAITASEMFATFFTFYNGSYTQDPDPTIEASLGVGNVPSYRGTCYIVFTDLPLELFHNAPPGSLQILCELVKSGTRSTGLREIEASDGIVQGPYMVYPVDLETGALNIQGDGVTYTHSIDGASYWGARLPLEPWETSWPVLDTSPPADGTRGVAKMFDDSAVRVYGSTNIQINNVAMLLYAEFESSDEGTGSSEFSALDLLPPTHYFLGAIPAATMRHICVFTGAVSGTVDTYWILEWRAGNVPGWSIYSTGSAPHPAGWDAIGPSAQGRYPSGCMESDLLHVWAISGISSAIDCVALWEIDEDTGAMSLIDSIGSTFVPGFLFDTSRLWADNGIAYCLYSFDNYYRVFTRNAYAATNDADLADVVESELLLAGLTAPQIDVSALVGIPVDGVLVPRVSATRGVLSNLQRAYFFDQFESNGQVKAVLKGGASIVTISQDDLAATEAPIAADDPVASQRTEDDALPGSISVAYIDRSIDYQIGAQEDRRAAVLTEQPIGIDLGLVLSLQKAKDVASVLLYDAWLTRTKRAFRTSRKYAYLEPGDIVTLDLDDVSLVVMLVKVKISGGIMEFEAVDADSGVYDPNTQAGNVGTGSTLTPSYPTMFALMDLPPLLAADGSAAGYYFAAAGYAAGWPGANLIVSNDGGATYDALLAMTSSATMGGVSNTLGDYLGGNFLDASNTLTVALVPSSSALQSVTADDLLTGSNIAAVGSEANGWELVQFKTATLITGTTYTLSRLLRGRLGTEDKIATHGAYETFVLLTPSTIRRVSDALAMLGTERSYKAVTFGQRSSAAIAKAFTNTDRSLECYSPVSAQATGFGGDIVITWDRRDRLNNGWYNLIDVPMSEATESYEIDIYNGSSVVRTLTSSTDSVTYSSANQITDFGSNPSTIDVRIYQMSALVGRGFPCVATLS